MNRGHGWKGFKNPLLREDSLTSWTWKSALRKEMDEVLDQEEMLWFQKSRLDAIKDGDKNTRYFHLSTIIR